MNRVIRRLCLAVFVATMAPATVLAGPYCPRPDVGSDVLPPPELHSSGGILNVALNYWASADDAGRTLFCFRTPDGLESPTLRVNPGDTIKITLTNRVLRPAGGVSEVISNKRNRCGDDTMTYSSVNMHFHGVNTSPRCHSDEAIHTIVSSGQTFTYNIKVPADEPPGLYWYHPHVHGIASAAVQGGATGLIVVEGIENIQPAVAGLPERLLIIRDGPLLNALGNRPPPFWDVSTNYVSVPYPNYPPALIKMEAGTREFWRLANSSANTILDLQVVYDGTPQVLHIVGFDGVPAGSQDGKRQGTIVKQKHILLPPAGRVEFIVDGPSKGVAKALLMTRTIDGGPASDNNPKRPLAQLIVRDKATKLPLMAKPSRPPNPQRFEDIDQAKVTAKRTLFFAESLGHANSAKRPRTEPVNFFITVDGQTSELYNPNNRPAIVTTEGAVEDWTIENRTFEVHEFHMHQIHFKVLEVNGKLLPKEQQQWRDTFQVPYWLGEGKYPSIKVRMDFRGAVVGDFVYHCHILDHEDAGMMAIIRVKPKS